MVSDRAFIFHIVFLVIRPFLWYQGEGHLLRSRSNIKVTLRKKSGPFGALVFCKHSLFTQTCTQSFRKQALVFSCLSYKSLGNTVGKGETAYNEQFLLLQQHFLPFWRTIYFYHTYICLLQSLSVWKSKKKWFGKG